MARSRRHPRIVPVKALAALTAFAAGALLSRAFHLPRLPALAGSWQRHEQRLVARSLVARAAEAEQAEKAEQRPPWDALRALRTAAFFGAVPNPLDALRRDDSEAIGLGPGERLWSLENPRNLVWGVLDDVIMGGASESSLQGNVWNGNIITAGGGFAGIRTQALRPALDVSGCQGIRIRVRGGGDQRFKFIIRDSYDWNGIAWSYEFDTKSWNPFSDGVTEVSAPFSEFVPTVFAKRVPDVTFDASQLSAMQLTLSKFGYDGDLNPNFRAGEFSITLESIDTF